MKKYIITTLLLLCIAGLFTAAHAQEKLDKLMEETTPEERAEMQTDYMQENLSLTEEQKPLIYDINLKYARLMEEAYRSGGGKLQKFRKMKSISQEKDGELKKVMDTTQYETYQKNKEEMKEKLKERVKEKRKEKN